MFSFEHFLCWSWKIGLRSKCYVYYSVTVLLQAEAEQLRKVNTNLQNQQSKVFC